MVAGASERSIGWRVVSAALASIVVLALVAGAGCNTNDQAGPVPVREAGPPGMLEQVTTGGGGAAVASSGGNPFGSLPEDAAEEPEPVSDGATPGASFDGGDGGDGATAFTCVDYAPPTCGFGATCDLRYNTCCVDAQLQARCVAKPEPCEPSEDSVACVQACECPGSQVCCGFYYDLMQVVGSACQTVQPGQFCQPNPQTNTQASAQLCATQEECTQSQCINQTCVDGVTLSVCGLQSQDPFDCVANEAGP
jgi:hypothetical protein